jgi:hypothetical protein
MRFADERWLRMNNNDRSRAHDQAIIRISPQRASGADLPFAPSRALVAGARQIRKLHCKPIFAGGPLIATFAHGFAAMKAQVGIGPRVRELKFPRFASSAEGAA